MRVDLPRLVQRMKRRLYIRPISRSPGLAGSAFHAAAQERGSLRWHQNANLDKPKIVRVQFAFVPHLLAAPVLRTQLDWCRCQRAGELERNGYQQITPQSFREVPPHPVHEVGATVQDGVCLSNRPGNLVCDWRFCRGVGFDTIPDRL